MSSGQFTALMVALGVIIGMTLAISARLAIIADILRAANP